MTSFPDDKPPDRSAESNSLARAPTREPDRLVTGDIPIEGGDGPLILELTNDGRLRAPRERTREILRERLIRAEVLPTGRVWTVMRTISPPPVESTRERAEADREVVMAGVLGASSVALIDIIGFLASGLQTGALAVMGGEFTRIVNLRSGDVVGARSSAPDETIGELLVRRGKITRSQLGEVVRKAGADRVGRACVQAGYVAPHDLWTLVHALHTEIFDRLMSTEAGLWTFSRISEDDLANSPLHLPTQHLLMDGLRRVDEMRLYREVVRSAECLVRRTGRDPASVDLRPDVAEEVRAMLGHITSTSSILHLMQKTGRGEFDVTRLVYHLHKAGAVEVLAADLPGVRMQAQGAVSKAEALHGITIYSMAVREIYEEVGRRQQSTELHHAVLGFLADRSTSVSPLLRALRLRSDGSLDEDVLLVELAAHPVSARQLREALDELLFFALFQATEMVPLRRRDDLARRVKMIQAMLVDGSP